EQGYVVRTVAQRAEVRGRALLGYEGDGASVRRIGGVELCVRIVGELRGAARLQVDQIEIADPAFETAEGDRAAIGRPGRVGDLTDSGNRELPHLPGVPRIHNDQYVAPPFEGAEGEVAAIGRPGAGGVDVAEAAVMRVERSALLKRADHPTGGCVGQVELRIDEVRVGDEGDESAVGGKGRRHVEPAPDAVGGDER